MQDHIRPSLRLGGHFALRRVIDKFHAGRRGGDLADILFGHQLVQILGQASFLGVEELDFLVQRCQVNGLDGELLRLDQSADITVAGLRRGRSVIDRRHRGGRAGTVLILAATREDESGNQKSHATGGFHIAILRRHRREIKCFGRELEPLAIGRDTLATGHYSKSGMRIRY